MDEAHRHWMRNQFTSKTEDYSEKIEKSIFVGTWNTNGRKLNQEQGESIRNWLIPNISEEEDKAFKEALLKHYNNDSQDTDHPTIPTEKKASKADIYAIGFQEIVDLNVMNTMVRGTQSDEMAEYWTKEILQVLNENDEDEYILLEEKHMVGILCAIFVKKNLLFSIKYLKSNMVATGIAGVVGNKGGIVIRMNIFDSTICFVCAHFHANRDNVAARNLDFKTIIDQSNFTIDNEVDNSKDVDSFRRLFTNRTRGCSVSVLTELRSGSESYM